MGKSGNNIRPLSTCHDDLSSINISGGAFAEIMSTRTWNAGFGQNLTLFIMVLFWTLLILLAIIQTNWNWNFGTVVGLIFVICVVYGWVLFFFVRSGSRSNLSKTSFGR